MNVHNPVSGSTQKRNNFSRRTSCFACNAEPNLFSFVRCQINVCLLPSRSGLQGRHNSPCMMPLGTVLMSQSNSAPHVDMYITSAKSGIAPILSKATKTTDYQVFCCEFLSDCQ